MSDLISRENLKNIMKCNLHSWGAQGILVDEVMKTIDSAPTVEYPFYAEAYQTGFEEAKVIIIHSIAEQYTAHNELVPIWLNIGDIKGGAKND